MLPVDLEPEHFTAYPPEAKKLAMANLPMLRSLPLIFLPNLLRELIEYDYKFPAERSTMSRELDTLSALPAARLAQWFQGFNQLTIETKLEHIDWVNSPALFVQQESAYLWSTHQMDAFRKSAVDYGEQVRSATSEDPLPVNRLGIAIVGQGVARWSDPLFRNLRAHGTYFANLKPANGLELLRLGVEARAKAHPSAYGHWYIDGSCPDLQPAASLTYVSYENLTPIRSALLKHIDSKVGQPGMGPEELRADLANLSPANLGVSGTGDPILDRFQVKVLTEGSGTQLFSTSFVQWTTREALRRAQPLTLMARFTPRQRQRPMDELLADTKGESDLDPAGSLVDADMSAYYHWINQQRLAGSQHSAFIAWYEGHSQAVVISSTLPRGAESESTFDLGELLTLATT
jgi:hypothetical protein